MNQASLLELLAAVESGAVRPVDAADRLTEELVKLPYEDIGHARIDHHRTLRHGLPEVIFAAGKTAEQTAAIFARIAASGADVLATRIDEGGVAAVLAAVPEARHHAMARAVTLRQSPDGSPRGRIAILCAGTSDLPVAEEAAVTAELFGARVPRLFDVGVPVIAVPTSVGYGASFGGTTALLGMLNSCSPNVTVVNIDNGFGAAYSATLIARAAHRVKN